MSAKRSIWFQVIKGNQNSRFFYVPPVFLPPSILLCSIQLITVMKRRGNSCLTISRVLVCHYRAGKYAVDSWFVHNLHVHVYVRNNGDAVLNIHNEAWKDRITMRPTRRSQGIYGALRRPNRRCYFSLLPLHSSHWHRCRRIGVTIISQAVHKMRLMSYPLHCLGHLRADLPVALDSVEHVGVFLGLRSRKKFNVKLLGDQWMMKHCGAWMPAAVKAEPNLNGRRTNIPHKMKQNSSAP